MSKLDSSRSACNSKGSMIVVSNRLPFILTRNEKTGELARKASAGGLVTAVAPVVIRGGGIWVGWPGIHLKDHEKIPESDPKDKTPTAGLLSEKQEDWTTKMQAMDDLSIGLKERAREREDLYPAVVYFSRQLPHQRIRPVSRRTLQTLTDTKYIQTRQPFMNHINL